MRVEGDSMFVKIFALATVFVCGSLPALSYATVKQAGQHDCTCTVNGKTYALGKSCDKKASLTCYPSAAGGSLALQMNYTSCAPYSSAGCIAAWNMPAGALNPPDPKKDCKVTGGAGKSLKQMSGTKAECSKACAEFDKTNPKRTCQWGSDKLR
jgi:hypothetical protein